MKCQGDADMLNLINVQHS